ncbi:MAG: DUF1638 domain-containing protein [Synergistaceae bacterium]|jgi:hypothetical protein|nr:DUF1638 domain-containing protein [Synergistaceae bacterium]
MRLKVIACDVLRREAGYLAARSDCYVDVTYLPQGLHEEPDRLRETVQEQIRIAESGFPYNHFGLRPDYDYIVLAYGLCSNGTLGLVNEKIPLVVPRAHDCITLLLGSKAEYSRIFSERPGTYWYSRGWIECSLQPGKERYTNVYREYEEKYGEDNAEYLMEMEQSWFTKYNRAVFIDWPGLNDSESYRNYTKECAEYLKWNYDEIMGDPGLLARVLNGIFDGNEVLIVPPGGKIAATYGEDIIKLE